MLEVLATYPDRAQLFREYPELEPEDVRSVLAYAATVLEHATARRGFLEGRNTSSN